MVEEESLTPASCPLSATYASVRAYAMRAHVHAHTHTKHMHIHHTQETGKTTVTQLSWLPVRGGQGTCCGIYLMCLVGIACWIFWKLPMVPYLRLMGDTLPASTEICSKLAIHLSGEGSDLAHQKLWALPPWEGGHMAYYPATPEAEAELKRLFGCSRRAPRVTWASRLRTTQGTHRAQPTFSGGLSTPAASQHTDMPGYVDIPQMSDRF